MNDQPNPNNLSSASENPNSVEARLARAAQQLDTAAANYAYRTNADVVASAPETPSQQVLPIRLAGWMRTPSVRVTKSARPRLIQVLRSTRGRAPKRRFAPFAAIAGAIAFAGSLVFGASVISNQAEAPPKNVPIEVASPTIPIVVTSPSSDFPFVGELRVSLPSTQLKNQAEELIFRDGVALSSIDQRRLTLASAIDIDLEADGKKELAVLINHDAALTGETVAVPTIPEAKIVSGDLSKSPSELIQPDPKAGSKLDAKSAGKSVSKSVGKADGPLSGKSVDAAPRATSAVAIVRVGEGGVAQTLATTPGFDVRIDSLLMNNKTLWGVQPLSNGSFDSGEAILRRAIIDLDRGVIGWADAEQPIARTSLPRIVEGDKQIRFLDGTKSALVFAAAGTRTGWFTAKVGQKLTIATLGIPSGKNRQIALQFRTGSNNKRVVSNRLLPQPLTVVLPNTGDYEIVIGEGNGEIGAETTFELSIE